MKLVFVLLLVLPLAWANQRPADVKIIFADGFIIAEGSDSPTIRSSSNHGTYGFFLQNNRSLSNYYAFMELKENLLKKKSTSFVIESWLNPGPKKQLDKASCLKHSSDSLKHLINSCYENVLLREATNEELSQVQKFKEEFERTKIPSKIVYKNMTIKAQWNANVERVQFDIDVWDLYLKRPDGNYIRTFASEGTNIFRLMKIQNYQKDRAFVIEGVPRDGRSVNCHDVKPLHDLTIKDCTGPVRARALTEDDQ